MTDPSDKPRINLDLAPGITMYELSGVCRTGDPELVRLQSEDGSTWLLTPVDSPFVDPRTHFGIRIDGGDETHQAAVLYEEEDGIRNFPSLAIGRQSLREPMGIEIVQWNGEIVHEFFTDIVAAELRFAELFRINFVD